MIPAPAAAEGEDLGVILSIDPCIDADAALVRRLFAVELDTSMSSRTAIEPGAAARVELGCEGALVVIQVHDPVTGKSLIRRISPGRRTGRERLLALAVMELLVASWIELEATPEPVVPAADTRANNQVRQSARQVARTRLPAPSWTTSASVLASAAWTGGVHGGAGVRVARDRVDGLGWAAEIMVETATDELSLGTVTTNAMSGAATVHLGRAAGAVRGRVAVGARLAVASMAGEPAQPGAAVGEAITGFLGGPLVRLDAALRPASGLTLSLSAESGVHLLSMRALVDGREERVRQRPWLGAQIGVGWTW